MSSQYQNQNSSTPLDRASFNPLGMVTSAVDSVAGAFNSLLTSAGISSLSAADQTAKQADATTATGDAMYYAAQGLATNRVSAADMAQLRSGNSPDTPSGEKYSVEISPQGRIASRTLAGGGNADIYPPDMGNYFFELNFMKYERPVPFSPATVDTEYTVTLPVPSGLIEYYDVNWQPSELGVVGDVADAMARNGGTLEDAGKNVVKGGGAAALRMLGTGALGTLASQEFGVAPNPNLSMAFRGPMLRQFNFVWTFAPKNADESYILTGIIKRMKERILPGMDSGATQLLGYPNMIQPRLYPTEVFEGTMDYTFKKCVIPRMNVSYSPTGIPSFFKGTNLPTFVQLAITLVEIEYWTSSLNTDSVKNFQSNNDLPQNADLSSQLQAPSGGQ